MLVPVEARAVAIPVLMKKVNDRIDAINHHFPDFRHQFASLQKKDYDYYLQYKIPEMEKVFLQWTGKLKDNQLDYFPAYCRLMYLSEHLDLDEPELPLMDCKRHYFYYDIEFLCFADLTELLTPQKLLDLLGIPLEVYHE